MITIRSGSVTQSPTYIHYNGREVFVANVLFSFRSPEYGGSGEVQHYFATRDTPDGAVRQWNSLGEMHIHEKELKPFPLDDMAIRAGESVERGFMAAKWLFDEKRARLDARRRRWRFDATWIYNRLLRERNAEDEAMKSAWIGLTCWETWYRVGYFALHLSLHHYRARPRAL